MSGAILNCCYTTSITLIDDADARTQPQFLVAKVCRPHPFRTSRARRTTALRKTALKEIAMALRFFLLVSRPPMQSELWID